MGLPYEMFENRVRKMARHIGKWARRQGITCYRIYDRDVPQFPLIVEKYEADYVVSIFELDTGLHAQEDWADLALARLAAALETDPSRIHARVRSRLEGGTHAEAGASRMIWAVEAGLKFEVDLSGRLDTGLFLHHRMTREIVRSESKGRDFLNLFAYTGSFSVAAAAGGAHSTTTVDLSKVYLDRARKNMEANAFTQPSHSYVQMDIHAHLDDLPASSYDLIVLDPPTFSRSRRMERDMDIKRDHPALIARSLRLLREGGILYFSSNMKKFRLQADELPGCIIQDYTKRTIPPDFRMHEPHRLYRIQPGEAAPEQNAKRA